MKDIPNPFAIIIEKLEEYNSRLARVESLLLQPVEKEQIEGGYEFAAEVLGYAKKTLYKYKSEGSIPYKEIRGKVIFNKKDLEEWKRLGKPTFAEFKQRKI